MSPPERASEKAVEEKSALADFGVAAFDSAIQKPINGLTQLGGRLIGHELPKLQLVDASVAPGSSETFAHRAGATLGMIVPFLATRSVVRGAAGSKLNGSMLGVAAEGGATGFLMGSVLRPVDDDQNFWSNRLANGVTDAGTFASLNLAARGLASTKAMSLTSEMSLVGRFGRGAAVGAGSGLPAGFVGAELNSLTHGHGFASASEIGTSMKDFALFGGAIGGVGGAASRSRFLSLDAKEAQHAKTGPLKADAPKVGETALPKEAAPVKEPVAEKTGAERNGAPRESVPKPESDKVLKFDSKRHLGEGDEGAVYSNGDGTVTKVYNDSAKSMAEVQGIFEKLESIGIKTPQIFETGKTAEGKPAMRMQQVGDGDHLQMQIITRELSASEMQAMNKQYYAYADALERAGIRIDWQLKNMRFQDGTLYVLDPSFLKNEPQGQWLVDRYAGAVGPRR